MSERRKKPDAAGAAVTGPKPRRRRHLEGLAFYVVYVPLVITAGFAVMVFMYLVERALGYGED